MVVQGTGGEWEDEARVAEQHPSIPGPTESGHPSQDDSSILTPASQSSSASARGIGARIQQAVEYTKAQVGTAKTALGLHRFSIYRHPLLFTCLAIVAALALSIIFADLHCMLLGDYLSDYEPLKCYK